MKMCFLLIAFLALNSPLLLAQNDTLKAKQKFTASAFLELYYSYDLNEPKNERRPDFLYNYVKHKQPSLNLGAVKLSYQTKLFRANVASMVGDVAMSTQVGEPNPVNYILEANLGVRLSKHIWFDAGIIPSHLGFESLASKESWNLTRSMVAENSPYWESGARLACDISEKWKLSVFYLNGWQRRWPQELSSQPSFGTQLVYNPNKKWLFNYSTFAGYPVNGNHEIYRLYHNLYFTWKASVKTDLMIGVDVGSDLFPDDIWRSWCAPTVMFRQRLISNLYAGIRAEYFYDPKEVLIVTSQRKGFGVAGLSANIDYGFLRYFIGRVEWRLFQADEAIFIKNETAVNQNQAVTASIILSL